MMNFTETQVKLESVKVVQKGFKVMESKSPRLVFGKISGTKEDGFSLEVLDGKLVQVCRDRGNSIITTNYLVRLLDGKLESVSRNQVIEVIYSK